MIVLAIQTTLGKAFEYACLNSIRAHLFLTQEVVTQHTAALVVAQSFYNLSTNVMRQKMDSAANAAIRVLTRLEPQLENPMGNTPLHLTIQEDSVGIAGDVRDVLTVRTQNGWGIGISCKHNHSAVKHSRLSSTINFGQLWFNIPCTQNYFNDINPLFDELRVMREGRMSWSSVTNKEGRFYEPLLRAFIAELRRLDAVNPGLIPERLLRYLLGSNDFYKVITHDRRRVTQIQAFNIYGTLNRVAGTIRPQTRIQQLTMPTRFHNIDFRLGSRNSVDIVCDEGWSVRLRIHNASTLVEPSLKFDVTLIGVPQGLYSHHEPW